MMVVIRGEMAREMIICCADLTSRRPARPLMYFVGANAVSDLANVVGGGAAAAANEGRAHFTPFAAKCAKLGRVGFS